MLAIARGAVPVFFRTVVFAALATPTAWAPKSMLAGVGVSAGAGVAPVPDSATACGEPAASSVTVTLALRLPAALGVKTTDIVHVASAASVAGQSSLSAKSAGF